LAGAGQVGRARDYLRRAQDALDRLGLPPSDEHADLRSLTGAAAG
jgi:hypothetical protein